MSIGAAITGGISLIGTIMGADGARREGQARKRQLDYQASLNEEEAARVEEQTVDQLRRFRIEAAKATGSNRAAIAASGIRLGGSAQAILEENAMNMAKDEVNIQLAGDRRAEALREEARLNRMGGQSAQASGSTRASAQLLSGIGSIGYRMYTGTKTPAPTGGD